MYSKDSKIMMGRHRNIEKEIISLLEENDKMSWRTRAYTLYKYNLLESLTFLEKMSSQSELSIKGVKLIRQFMFSIAAEAKNAERGYDLELVARKIIPLLRNEEEKLQWVFCLYRIYPAALFVPNIFRPESIPISCRFDQNFLATLNSCISVERPVLLTGETGTGKELFAKTIHLLSNRRDFPFVAVNVSGLPANLIESELFGHVKGAFTGAIRNRAGCFEESGQGTLFLDEIGDMPIEAQTRLLRVLSDNTFIPVGGSQYRKVVSHSRLICATNKNIPLLIERENFRKDLFYRINTFQLTLPTLRQVLKKMSNETYENDNRQFFFKSIADDIADEISYPYNIETRDRDVIEKLSAYSYPGNYRDLHNVLTRAIALLKPKGRSVITSDEIIFSDSDSKYLSEERGVNVNYLSFQEILRKAELYKDTLVQKKVESLLRKHKGIVRDAAAEAGFGNNKNATTKFNKLANKYSIRWQNIRKALSN